MTQPLFFSLQKSKPFFRIQMEICQTIKMAICRTFKDLCSLFLGYVDLLIAYFLLCFATVTFFFKTIIGPFNAILVCLDSFLFNISTRKISNVRREVFRLIQSDVEFLELRNNSRREVTEGESLRGPDFSRRESTLSVNSGVITGYTGAITGYTGAISDNTEITERTDVNLEGGNAAIDALKEEKVAHASLRRELQKERRAAATAAEEAMAMILRLQEEKAAIEMEARQYRAVAEGKAKYEEEEIEILEEIILKKDREKLILEKEVEAYMQILGSDSVDNEEKDGNSSENVNNEQKNGNEINPEFPEKGMVTTETFTEMPSSSNGKYGFYDIDLSKYSSNESSMKNEEVKSENKVHHNVHDVHIISDDSKERLIF